MRPVIVALAAGLLLACAWAATGSAVLAHRAEARLRIGADLSRQAQGLASRLQTELLEGGQTLRSLAAAIGHDPDNFDLAAWQHDNSDPATAGRAILIANAAGIVHASTRPGLLGTDIAGQDYFRAARERGARDTRIVASALRGGELPWQWHLMLAQPVAGSDGAFAGIIATSVDTSAPPDADLDPNGMIALFSFADARLHPLAGNLNSLADRSLQGTGLASAIAESAAGVWRGALPPDGARRIVAFRRVPGAKLVILAGVDAADAMRPEESWEGRAWLFAASASLVIAVTAALLLWLDARRDRQSRRLAQDHAALLARMAQLEATLAGMGDGIMMVDADLRLLEWNASFSDLTGVPRDILRVGMTMEEMLHAQAEAGEFGAVDVDAEVQRRMASIRAGASVGMIQRMRPDGRMLELRRNPLPGGGFVTLYTDVTARHAMEERLHQSQKMAAVGRLTAGVAHDFNNLLATIVGSAELIERQIGDNPGLARRLELIMQAAGRGSDLVRQLLAFARQQPLEPVLVDLNEVLGGMTALLRATVGSRVRVNAKLAEGLWPAWVDPVQIEHVILNLAINARDAMEDGGALSIVTANTILSDPRPNLELVPGEYVTVALSDTGTGMSDDILRKVFEPFFTTKGPGRGSGLGLSQVYGVASQSGGGVEIVSQRGHGTTVTVFLPRAEADAGRSTTRPGWPTRSDNRPPAARRRA